MRKILLFFLILVLPAFIFKEYHVLKSARESYVSRPAQVEKRQDIRHPFVFVMITEDNTDFCIKNLSSIFSQNYPNYRIILIDNGSQEKSFNDVQSYLFRKHPYRKNIVISRHKKRQAYARVFKEALDECREDEIVILLDPSNWLAHENVLASLNEAYADPEVWLAYAASLEYPSYRKYLLGQEKLKTHIRKPYRTPWNDAGMRTFYARLMKDVQFDETCSTEELFKPMVNLSKWHIRYIPDTLYIRNRLTIDHGMHRLQIGLRLDELTQNIHTQSHLAKLPGLPAKNTKADMIIFSSNRPFQLGISLESIYRYVRGIDRIYVLYETKEPHKQAYYDLQKRYPKVHFKEHNHAFKPILMSLLGDSLKENSYIVFASDGLIIKDPIYLQDCTGALDQTKAFAFFLDSASLAIASNSKSPSDRIHIIEIEPAQIITPFNMVIYTKSDIIQELRDIEFNNEQTLIKSWSTQSHTRRLGLFYDVSKATHMH